MTKSSEFLYGHLTWQQPTWRMQQWETQRDCLGG